MRIVPGTKVRQTLQQAVKPAKPKGNPDSIQIATVNDDFTDKKSNLRRVNADVVLLQETKNSRLRKVRPNSDRWGVHQAKREDKAGSSVVWDKKSVKATDRGYELGVKPQGAKMLKRWISWTDIKVGDQTVRMMSVHRPPARFKRLWPTSIATSRAS